MKLKHIIQFAVALFLVSNAQSTEINSLSMNDAIEEIREKYSLPSISMAVFTADSVLWDIQTGTISSESDRIITPDMTYQIGSMTKAMTGYVAARLVEDEKISWETKLFDIHPELKEDALELYSDISLANLLSHRSGIAAYEKSEELDDLLSQPYGDDRKEFTEHLLSLESEAVGYFNYSNAGYAVATLMLETVSGKTWKELLDIYIHEPYGIDFHHGLPTDKDSTFPLGHIEEDGAIVPGRGCAIPVASQPAGDITMSLPNVIKWGRVMQNVLNRSDTTLSLENRNVFFYGTEALIESWYPFEYDYMQFLGYGMGWYKMQIADTQYLVHTGVMDSFYSTFGIDIQSNRISVILINAYGDTVEAAAQEIHQLVQERTAL